MLCELYYTTLYHAIENTANQNTGKPLYIRRYSTQPSHRALRSYSRRNSVSVFSTANQNTGKPLYIRRYSTQPSHRALRSYSRRNSVSVFSMVWYKIVTQHFRVVYYGIPHLSLVFSSYTHSPKGSCVYRENTSDSWDIV